MIIPNQITDIKEMAFSNSFIKRITFTNDLNFVGQLLCTDCDLLEEIDFGENLTTIHRGMFFNCDNLKEVIIPNNITTIQSNAFERCLNLKKVTFNEGLQSIGQEAFYFCYNLENVVLPKSLKTIRDRAFCMSMTSFILYDTIEEIGNGAFFSSTIYTNRSHRSSSGVGGNGSVFTDCEIVDGYLYSFHFYKYEEVIDNTHRHYGSLFFGPSGDDEIPDSYSPSRCEIPYREGYKFLGFSYKENSNEIDIYPEEFEYEHNFSFGSYLKKCLVSITGNKSKTLENDTILYAVWEKK